MVLILLWVVDNTKEANEPILMCRTYKAGLQEST